MINFYLSRLVAKSKDERQKYLDETVAVIFRDQVRDAWNDAHSDSPLK